METSENGKVSNSDDENTMETHSNRNESLNSHTDDNIIHRGLLSTCNSISHSDAGSAATNDFSKNNDENLSNESAESVQKSESSTLKSPKKTLFRLKDENAWLTDVGSFKEKQKQLESSSTAIDSDVESKDEPSTSGRFLRRQNNVEECAHEKDHSVEDESSTSPNSKKRRKHNSASSNESDEQSQSEPLKTTQEEWLDKDLQKLPPNSWMAVKELQKRQLGQNSYTWTNKVRASVGMVRRFRINWELKKHQGCVNALHFNQSGSLLASGSDDLRIMIWDWVDPTKSPVITYNSGHRNNIFQAKFMPNCGDTSVVSTARDGQVRLGTISNSGDSVGTKKIAQHHGSAHKITFKPNSNSVFLSCGEDGCVFNIDTRLERPSKKMLTVRCQNSKIPLYSIHNNPIKEYEFAVSGRDSKAFMFDERMIRTSENTYCTKTAPVKEYCPRHLQDSKSNITCLSYNWNGKELLCSYNDEDIYLFDTKFSADYTKRYKGHRNRATVKGVNFYGSRSEYIISGSDCGNMFMWEKESARILNFSEGDTGGVVNVLEPHPEFPTIATSGLDSEIKIWTPILDPSEKLCSNKLKKVISNRLLYHVTSN